MLMAINPTLETVYWFDSLNHDARNTAKKIINRAFIYYHTEKKQKSRNPTGPTWVTVPVFLILCYLLDLLLIKNL